MEPDEVDAYLSQHEEEYWEWSHANKQKEVAPMGEPISIEVMAAKMYDEVHVTKALDEIRDNLFRVQFEGAFCHVDGPHAYWKELEAAWRKVSGGDPIPTKYRTNKSVILKAWGVDAGLAAWYTEKKGEACAMGKSAVQEKCMKIQKVSKTAEGMARHIISQMDQYCTDGGSAEWANMCKLVCEDIEGKLV